jgi:glutaredoxin
VAQSNKEIVLYTTGCPKCRILKAKLDAKGMVYTVCEDVDKMEKLGFTSVPILSVNGNFYDFYDALAYINTEL